MRTSRRSVPHAGLDGRCSSSTTTGAAAVMDPGQSLLAGCRVGCSSSKTEGNTSVPSALGRDERLDGVTCSDSPCVLNCPLSLFTSHSVGRLWHTQWCARHSGSRAAFSAAFELCTPRVTAAPAVCVRQSNNSCWLEHGHPGYGGTKTLSTSTGSRVGRSPAGNDCAPVLSHSPRVTSEDWHGRAGVRVVSLPGDPFPWFGWVPLGFLRQTRGESM